MRNCWTLLCAGLTLLVAPALAQDVAKDVSPNGWQAASQDALGYFTTVVRDGAGQTICVVDANSGRYTTLFDVRGLTVAQQDQIGAFMSFSFDPDRNRILRVDARD